MIFSPPAKRRWSDEKKRYRPIGHPANLENLRADFPTLEVLIAERERLGCNGELPRKWRELVYRFDNTYFFSEEIEDVLCEPESFWAEVIRQQADDIATGVWRWWHNRRPIKISLEIEIIIGIYFNIYPGSGLFNKMLFVQEDVLNMCDSNKMHVQNLLRKKFSFLGEIKKPTPENWREFVAACKKNYGASHKVFLEW